jgi:CHAD domain-containing protein
MATIDLIGAVRDDQALRKARRDLRKHLKAFGPLRDTHVQILEVRALARRFPVLRSYLRSLSQTEAALIGKARAYLARMRLEGIEQTLARSRGELAELLGAPEMHRYVSSALAGEAGKSFLRAAERLGRVNTGDPASIHRLRVAFKKCRYTLEILRPLLPGTSASLLKGMNAYQTRMGVIQDSVVLSSSLARFAVRNTRVSTAAMGAVQHALVERRRGLIQEFFERADELHRFWREPIASPGASDTSSQTSRE